MAINRMSDKVKRYKTNLVEGDPISTDPKTLIQDYLKKEGFVWDGSSPAWLAPKTCLTILDPGDIHPSLASTSFLPYPLESLRVVRVGTDEGRVLLLRELYKINDPEDGTVYHHASIHITSDGSLSQEAYSGGRLYPVLNFDVSEKGFKELQQYWEDYKASCPKRLQRFKEDISHLIDQTLKDHKLEMQELRKRLKAEGFQEDEGWNSAGRLFFSKTLDFKNEDQILKEGFKLEARIILEMLKGPEGKAKVSVLLTLFEPASGDDDCYWGFILPREAWKDVVTMRPETVSSVEEALAQIDERIKTLEDFTEDEEVTFDEGLSLQEALRLLRRAHKH